MRLGLAEEAETTSVWPEPLPPLMPDKFTVWRPAFSLTVKLPIALSVGERLTGLTVTVKDWETILLLAPPLLTVTVITAEPEALAAGVKVRVPVALGLAEEAETTSVWPEPLPPLMPDKFTVWRPAFSLTVKLPIALSVGGLLGG